MDVRDTALDAVGEALADPRERDPEWWDACEAMAEGRRFE